MLATHDIRTRIKTGREQESLIIQSLRKAGFNLTPASDHDDMIRKIDCWLGQTPVQVKYRENGTSILFEVYDTFEDWDSPRNKIGRDMKGVSEIYAVRIGNRIFVAKTQEIKGIINLMLTVVKQYGWTEVCGMTKTFKFRKNNLEIFLKIQRDPSDGRTKMVAYLPPETLSVQSYEA